MLGRRRCRRPSPMPPSPWRAGRRRLGGGPAPRPCRTSPDRRGKLHNRAGPAADCMDCPRYAGTTSQRPGRRPPLRTLPRPARRTDHVYARPCTSVEFSPPRLAQHRRRSGATHRPGRADPRPDVRPGRRPDCRAPTRGRHPPTAPRRGRLQGHDRSAAGDRPPETPPSRRLSGRAGRSAPGLRVGCLPGVRSRGRRQPSVCGCPMGLPQSSPWPNGGCQRPPGRGHAPAGHRGASSSRSGAGRNDGPRGCSHHHALPYALRPGSSASTEVARAGRLGGSRVWPGHVGRYGGHRPAIRAPSRWASSCRCSG